MSGDIKQAVSDAEEYCWVGRWIHR